MPIKNPEAIANAIIDFINDMERAKLLGQSAKSHLLKYLTVEVTVDKIFKVYESLLMD